MAGLTLMAEAVPVLVTLRLTVKSWPEGMPTGGTGSLAERVAGVTKLTAELVARAAAMGPPVLASLPAAMAEKLTLPTELAEKVQVKSWLTPPEMVKAAGEEISTRPPVEPAVIVT